MAASRLKESAIKAARGGEATPFYLMDLDAVEHRFLAMRDAWKGVFESHVEIAYSYKTNGLTALARHLRVLGAAAEVVCGAELEWALADGHTGKHIYFDGPVKTIAEMARAIAVGARLQIDSLDELPGILEGAAIQGVPSPALSARLALPNPHAGVSRFGLLISEFDALHRELRAANLTLDGVHVHAGNKCAMPATFAELATLAAPCLRLLQRRHPRVVLDLGGGFPSRRAFANVDPPSDIAYAEAVHAALVIGGIELDRLSIVLEPGRALTEDFGILALRVVARKHRGETNLLVVDGGASLAGMGGVSRDFVTIVDSVPAIVPYQVFGSNCFERDLLAVGVAGPPDVACGTLLLVEGVGGYALNTAPAWIRPLPGILALKNGILHRARRAQTHADVRARDADTLLEGMMFT
jgi:diaminopimelate decarboxylase